jgi:FrmR/RcnR family transcriptional regulator, repressor of frmRAB operon
MVKGPMAHTIADQTKLLNRVRRIRGQVEALERALAEERDCSDVLQIIAAARGAMGSLMGEVVEDHVRFHIVDPEKNPSSKQAQSAQQLIDVLKPYLR